MKTYSCLNCGTIHKWRGVNFANKYCDNKCQTEYQYKQYIAEWKQGIHNGMRGKLQTSDYIRRYVMEKQDGKCALCGINSWCDKPIKLELDHIDGNGTNNLENNLRCICPNCHSQTPTYKAKNKGNGRKLRNSFTLS